MSKQNAKADHEKARRFAVFLLSIPARNPAESTQNLAAAYADALETISRLQGEVVDEHDAYIKQALRGDRLDEKCARLERERDEAEAKEDEYRAMLTADWYAQKVSEARSERDAALAEVGRLTRMLNALEILNEENCEQATRDRGACAAMALALSTLLPKGETP